MLQAHLLFVLVRLQPLLADRLLGLQERELLLEDLLARSQHVVVQAAVWSAGLPRACVLLHSSLRQLGRLLCWGLGVHGRHAVTPRAHCIKYKCVKKS